MSEKVIALISQYPDIEDHISMMHDKNVFNRKRIDDLHKEMSEQKKADWEVLEDMLYKNNIIDETYNEKTHNLAFHKDNNSISIIEKCEHDELPSFIRNLFSRDD